MSDERITESISEQLHDIAADIEHQEIESEKKAAERRALEIRRRIETLREQRELEKSLLDYEFDDD